MNQDKKAKAVLIPTENKTNLWLSKSFNILRQSSSFIDDMRQAIGYQLLIISDDENERIEDEDWYLNSLNSYTIHRKSKDSNLPLYGIRKIIASHPPLEIIAISSSSNGKIIGSKKIKQPQPSQQFIEQYIESYNKGKVITDVLIEYENYCNHGYFPRVYNKDKQMIREGAGGHICTGEWRPKINPDNTITIKSVKDSWNREEVIELMKKYCIDIHRYTINSTDFNNWIKENL